MKLYPEIGLDERCFSVMSSKSWHAVSKRKFFDEVANKMQFDPLVVENWYSLSKQTVAAIPVFIYKYTFMFNINVQLLNSFNVVGRKNTVRVLLWRVTTTGAYSRLP